MALSLTVALTALTACGNHPASVSPNVSTGASQGTTKGGVVSQADAQTYRLGVGDKVHINVFSEENLSGDYVVSPEGNVVLPLAGPVKAEGMTVAEFKHEVVRTLILGYVQDPNVAISLVEMRPYFILGEVNKPGKYPYTPDLTVLNAVATAEGFTYRADMSEVYIRHARESGEKEYRLTSSTLVRPGDTIRVTERYF